MEAWELVGPGVRSSIHAAPTYRGQVLGRIDGRHRVDAASRTDCRMPLTSNRKAGDTLGKHSVAFGMAEASASKRAGPGSWVRKIASIGIIATVVCTALAVLFCGEILVVFWFSRTDLDVVADSSWAGFAVLRDGEVVGHLRRVDTAAILCVRLGHPERLPSTVAIQAPDGTQVAARAFQSWRSENFFFPDTEPTPGRGEAAAPAMRETARGNPQTTWSTGNATRRDAR